MRDIVATIQPEQDELVRAELDEIDLRAGRARHRQDRGRPAPGGVPALPAPGAAAALGRADRRAEHARSCRYISAVLPALGEVEVQQSTVDDLIARVPVRGVDSPRPRRGQARRRGWPRCWPGRCGARLAKPTEPIMVSDGSYRWRIDAERAAPDRRRRAPGGACRTRSAGSGCGPGSSGCCSGRRRRRSGDSPSEALAAQDGQVAPVTAFLDAVWPAVTPESLVVELLTDPSRWRPTASSPTTSRRRCAGPKPPRTVKAARWSAPPTGAARRGGRADRAGAQLRARGGRRGAGPVARCSAGRSPGAASTARSPLLGDLAQGTAPWAAADWRGHARAPRQAGRARWCR